MIGAPSVQPILKLPIKPFKPILSLCNPNFQICFRNFRSEKQSNFRKFNKDRREYRYYTSDWTRHFLLAVMPNFMPIMSYQKAPDRYFSRYSNTSYDAKKYRLRTVSCTFHIHICVRHDFAIDFSFTTQCMSQRPNQINEQPP